VVDVNGIPKSKDSPNPNKINIVNVPIIEQAIAVNAFTVF
jgi:hypothetical protein